MKTTVARAIADRLAGSGVENFFLLTGGDQPLWIALRDRGIRMLLARSESGAAYMADGYARASGKPGLTYGQAGPGAANVAAALADAYWAQSPVVAVTGTTATRARYKVEYQAIDSQALLFAPVTIWQGEVGDPSQTPALVGLALRRALTGSRGPTHLDIPKDFFGREIDCDDASHSDLGVLPPAAPPLARRGNFSIASSPQIGRSWWPGRAWCGPVPKPPSKYSPSRSASRWQRPWAGRRACQDTIRLIWGSSAATRPRSRMRPWGRATAPS